MNCRLAADRTMTATIPFTTGPYSPERKKNNAMKLRTNGNKKITALSRLTERSLVSCRALLLVGGSVEK